MLKVTLIFLVYCTSLLLFRCKDEKNEPSVEQMQHFKDSVSEARIDSAYKEIRIHCDTLKVHQVPVMVDSFLKDPALLNAFFDTAYLYTDGDKKVEKVVRQLLADCDSSLLKETYRIAQHRQKLKPMRYKR